MMKKLLFALLFLSVFVSLQGAAFAQSPDSIDRNGGSGGSSSSGSSGASSNFNGFEQTCDGSPEANKSSVCNARSTTTTGSNSLYGPDGIITKVTNIVAIVGGIISVVMIMYAGLTMIMSQGDSGKFNEARNTMIYAAIGIVVIVLARVIVSFIVNRLWSP